MSAGACLGPSEPTARRVSMNPAWTPRTRVPWGRSSILRPLVIDHRAALEAQQDPMLGRLASIRRYRCDGERELFVWG